MIRDSDNPPNKNVFSAAPVLTDVEIWNKILWQLVSIDVTTCYVSDYLNSNLRSKGDHELVYSSGAVGKS